MESIEEQWGPPLDSTDILSDSWMDMANTKKAVKIWILDCGESWGNSTQNNITQLQLHIASYLPFPSDTIEVSQVDQDQYHMDDI
jgi:hypothetical protein